jgi:hypothetical protein
METGDGYTDSLAEVQEHLRSYLGCRSNIVGPGAPASFPVSGFWSSKEATQGLVVLDEWVTIMNWRAIEAGRDLATVLRSPQMPVHHVLGLLAMVERTL